MFFFTAFCFSLNKEKIALEGEPVLSTIDISGTDCIMKPVAGNEISVIYYHAFDPKRKGITIKLESDSDFTKSAKVTLDGDGFYSAENSDKLAFPADKDATTGKYTLTINKLLLRPYSTSSPKNDYLDITITLTNPTEAAKTTTYTIHFARNKNPCFTDAIIEKTGLEKGLQSDEYQTTINVYYYTTFKPDTDGFKLELTSTLETARYAKVTLSGDGFASADHSSDLSFPGKKVGGAYRLTIRNLKLKPIAAGEKNYKDLIVTLIDTSDETLKTEYTFKFREMIYLTKVTVPNTEYSKGFQPTEQTNRIDIIYFNSFEPVTEGVSMDLEAKNAVNAKVEISGDGFISVDDQNNLVFVEDAAKQISKLSLTHLKLKAIAKGDDGYKAVTIKITQDLDEKNTVTYTFYFIQQPAPSLLTLMIPYTTYDSRKEVDFASGKIHIFCGPKFDLEKGFDMDLEIDRHGKSAKVKLGGNGFVSADNAENLVFPDTATETGTYRLKIKNVKINGLEKDITVSLTHSVETDKTYTYDLYFRPSHDRIKSEEKSLTVGQIVGITVGCSAAVIVVAFIVYWLCCRKRRRRRANYGGEGGGGSSSSSSSS